MATFSLMREENGRMVQVGESVEATLPLAEPLQFGPLAAAPCRPVVRITDADGKQITELGFRSAVVEGGILVVSPRSFDPDRD